MIKLMAQKGIILKELLEAFQSPLILESGFTTTCMGYEVVFFSNISNKQII